MKTYLNYPFTQTAWLLCLICGMIVSTSIQTNAQQVYNLGPESTMQIDGTSTLHDWSSQVKFIRGEGEFTFNGSQIQDITHLKISVAVNSIKSGKSVMDKITYQALKAEQYPEVYYLLQSVKVLPDNKLATTGKLTIAGITRVANMELSYQPHSAGKITVTGSLPIRMQDYNIDPPTAMMGTIKTGEQVTLHFKAVFTAASQFSTL